MALRAMMPAMLMAAKAGLTTPRSTAKTRLKRSSHRWQELDCPLRRARRVDGLGAGAHVDALHRLG
jgi:hypothetical protein